MNTKLGMLKQAVLAACCAASVGAMPIAHADSIGIGYNSGWHGHSAYAVSVGTGPAYYGGYYYAPSYNPYRRCYYDYYGYYRCRPYYAGGYYYGGPYYGGPAVSIGYYGGWWHGGGWRGGGWSWHGHEWHR